MPPRCATLCSSARALALALALVLALVALRVSGQHDQRCTQAVAGDLVGYEVVQGAFTLEPDGRKAYIHTIDGEQGCALNGVSAQACDTYAPEVDVDGALAQVSVRRLGPRWHPVSLELVLYCDFLPPAGGHPAPPAADADVSLETGELE